METYYEHIRSKIKGMISSAYLDLYELDSDFNEFVEFVEQVYGQITESNFYYQVSYNDDKETSDKDYSHYVTLDNSIYVEVKTFLKNNSEESVINMEGAKIQSIIAYSSQDNNKKLINFMNVVNTFVTKNKEEKDNVK